jgi:hypothetical protein
VKLLKDNDNNDIIKEGILNVLAKAGGTIQEQLGVTSRCTVKLINSLNIITLYNILIIFLLFSFFLAVL